MAAVGGELWRLSHPALLLWPYSLEWACTEMSCITGSADMSLLALRRILPEGVKGSKVVLGVATGLCLAAVLYKARIAMGLASKGDTVKPAFGLCWSGNNMQCPLHRHCRWILCYRDESGQTACPGPGVSSCQQASRLGLPAELHCSPSLSVT